MAPAPQEECGRPASSPWVWVVATLLLLSVLAGGGCLVAYLVLPPSEAPRWLPFVGLSLVALPWLFWVTTSVYRCLTARSADRAVAPVACSLVSRAEMGTCDQL